ncbi:hypothetical protein BDV59DRAFT_211254 [Aspergillus ambiguus]|uniref:uncharacterized protein n=1 Tax=Aspergillus ambiguus TaxID=176160 RepID=UPI003CCD2979
MSTLPSTASLPREATLYLLHHVFFPPNIPQEDDYNAGYECILLDTVIQALRGFQQANVSDWEDAAVFTSVISMVYRLRKTCGFHGDMNKAERRKLLQNLDNQGEVLPIYLRCQNAAVLMTRHRDSIHVETFELSPRNESVYSTVGRLKRQFPGPTFALDQVTFNEPGLQTTIAETLAKMSHEPVTGTKAKVNKAGQQHDEDRDTTNPRMVTEFFTAFLRPRCRTYDSLQIQKNTREEVLWLNSRLPWRRSSLWLLVRVIIQLLLHRLRRGEQTANDLYKQFMVYYMSTLLNRSHDAMSSEHRYIMTAKIARRLHKLDMSQQPPWFPFVQKTLKKANDTIQQQWRDIMARNNTTHNDSECSLPDLDRWLEGVRGRGRYQTETNFQPQVRLLELESTEIPSLSDATEPDYRLYNLAAFEQWVERKLGTWLQAHLGNEAACEQLSGLISEYHGIAMSQYSGNPEALWIACDKSAIHLHPLLSDYDARIPVQLFESLVLPHLSQMRRLSSVENYLHQRRQRAFGTPSYFSVKYFDQSTEHQALLDNIEECATHDREAKKEELQKKQQEYKNLYTLYETSECMYDEVVVDGRFDNTESRHSPTCQRCQYKDKANSINIDAKSTVFELKLPRPFAFWRDTTIFILLTVLRVDYSEYIKSRAQYRPQTYRGLSSFFMPVHTSQRIGLLSQEKPHLGSHRRNKYVIDVLEEDVCLANGLKFRYFDNITDAMAVACTYSLPPSNDSLQGFLFRTPVTRNENGPSPNTAIASQHACPADMSLGEFKALCSMPLGVEIQWSNILRQLAAPSVVFKKVETFIFILQIIHQAGPLARDSSVLRAGHGILDDDVFAMTLLAEIRKTAERIRENWQSTHQLNSLICITQRVLSLSSSAKVQDICLDHLTYLRTIAFRWVIIIGEKASSAKGDKHRNELVAGSAHSALICVATFDSEGPLLERMLENEWESSVFIQCCMIIHDKKAVLDLNYDPLLLILYYRWGVLVYRCRRILVNSIVQCKKASLDQAIQRTWASLMVDEINGDFEMQVNYNLITGELLVDGRPLARLPSEYERHEIYKLLFGQSLVEVMPSDVPGMQFSGQREHMGQTIHLGKMWTLDPNYFDLCVRAIYNSRNWEHVPPRLLVGAFPDAFVEDYVHWYDIDGGYIEFRPVKEPWHSSRSHWRLQRTHQPNRWSLSSVQSLSAILQPIEKTSKLHCKLHHATYVLEIEVPRLRLSFNLRHGHSLVHSRQYRGMIIDPEHMLVLRHVSTCDRMLLLPEGRVTLGKDGDHVVVEVIWQAVTNTHVYSVDNQICRLTDNGSLQSKLMLSYLHAKTGTEQALSILRSASLRSSTERFYPANERVMQSIKWQHDLNCLAQHNDFREQVAAIFDEHQQENLLPAAHTDLLQRARIRSSTFCVSGFGAEDHAVAHDLHCSRVFTLCKTLYDEIVSMQEIAPKSLASHLWNFFSRCVKIYGPAAAVDMTRIQYDATLFLEPGQFVSSYWCIPMVVLQMLAAIYVMPTMASLDQGCKMNESELRTEVHLPPQAGEKSRAFKSRINRLRQRKRAEALDHFISELKSQWPTSTPSIPTPMESPKFEDYFNTVNAMNNVQFKSYLSAIACVLSHEPIEQVTMPSCSWPCLTQIPSGRRLGLPPQLQMEPPQLNGLLNTNPGNAEPAPRLLALVSALESQAGSDYERNYVEQLRGSMKSLQEIKALTCITPSDKELENIVYNSIVSRMTFSCAAGNDMQNQSLVYREVLNTLTSINVCPRLSPELLLQQLTRKRWSELSDAWKRCIIAYGRSVTALQRARKLLNLISHHEDLVVEIQNPGHTIWDPFEFPETLLLEIENGILIRDVQEQIARRMRHIRPGGNAVMQPNMGEGKSSVIVPIVAAALADESCLQMFHMLVTKLGGLLGRRIEEREAAEIERVLLVQPEHILSLKLMCLECFITGREVVGIRLLKVLEFFQKSSRDVVDESDENFSVKFELIYTMGAQAPLELTPQRWAFIQQILDLVRKYAPLIKANFPRSVELNNYRKGGFPRMRLLHADAGAELFRRVAKDACANGMDALSISRQPEKTRRAMLLYVLNQDLSDQEVAAVEHTGSSGFWSESTKGPLFLLRGLFAGNILAFCFGQKRWRVNYGLDIPYRAKDNPAARSEFSHPDVVIILTCLSYYYAGLSDEDLYLAFSHLIESDQADAEYQTWVDDTPSLLHPYRQLTGVNLEDRHHCVEHIFPRLRYAKGAIDYFLAHIVFPKELKEFPNKLSASGWDIGEVKTHPTVGFSGTNDSRVTLPLSVEQLDLAEQNHTNALVLEYLLRPETSVVLTPVILDVGAQILELTNFEVTQTWLRMTSSDGHIQAVVFVNDNDEICVVDRTGLVELLHMSPFGKHLEACFVFLDEAHTRWIDLKLPPNYRAAVTLGSGVTKDKLVQACMRLRKLGRGQSVVFCVPQEIKCRIMALTGQAEESNIDVTAVLRWAVAETWADVERSIPLWAVQGERFERQSNLWREIRKGGQTKMSASQAEAFLEPESKSLEQRYRPGFRNSSVPASESDDRETVRLIMDKCRQFCHINFGSTQLQEEQERELAPEIEQERQIQRPPSANAQKHYLHPDLCSFVSTGVLDTSSRCFMPAFKTLRTTSARKYLDVAQFLSELLVTSDFASAVQTPKGQPSDSYMRPIEWVLTSSGSSPPDNAVVKHMVIISPYEANLLVSKVRESAAGVRMHLYAPRQKQSFPPLDKLTLYSVPARSTDIHIPKSLRIQLNLFSGQLYISSYDEYLEICDFLGVASVTAPDNMVVAADGWIVSGGQQTRTFKQSPLKFLRVLMSQIRKDGQEIDKTHLGKIIDGKLLSKVDFPDGDRDI